MTVHVRRIRAEEWRRLRALRLQALAAAPLAFASTLAGEEAFSDEIWQERAAGAAAGVDRVTFVADDGARWLGLATGVLAGRSDLHDTFAALVGMFVDGSARHRGIGAALVENVVRWTRERGAARLILWVTSDNEAAVGLYHRCGFKPTGATRPLTHTPARSEHEMMRALDYASPD